MAYLVRCPFCGYPKRIDGNRMIARCRNSVCASTLILTPGDPDDVRALVRDNGKQPAIGVDWGRADGSTAVDAIFFYNGRQLTHIRSTAL